MKDLREMRRTVQQAWSGHHWTDWKATCADDYRFDPGLGVELDLQATMAWNLAIFTAFPDLTETVEHVYVDGATVISELLVHGTSKGDFVLFGEIRLPATGRRFQLRYAKVLQFNSEGLVRRDRQYQDWGSVRAQLLDSR